MDAQTQQQNNEPDYQGPYPVAEDVRVRLEYDGVPVLEQPYRIMLDALYGYEHGNTSTTDVHPELSLEAYGEAVYDLITIIRQGY